MEVMLKGGHDGLRTGDIKHVAEDVRETTEFYSMVHNLLLS